MRSVVVSGDRPRVWRSRWAAIGAAVAVTFGAGGLAAVNAAGGVDSTTVLTDPVRVLDSRDPVNVGLAGPFASQVSEKLQVTGSIPTTTGTKTVVPAGATGVLLNVTVVAPTADGFVSIRPGDATGTPSTSSLNFNAGQIVPNAVLVALPTSGANAGKIDITYDAFGKAGPTTDILIDVVGHTSSSTLAALQTEIDAVDATNAAQQSEIDMLGSANATQQTQIDAKANSADVYTKAQSDAGFLSTTQSLTFTPYNSSSNASTDGPFGCRTLGNDASLRLDLPLPNGATPTSVKAKYYDSSAEAMTIILRKVSFTFGSGVTDGYALEVTPPNSYYTIVTLAPGIGGQSLTAVAENVAYYIQVIAPTHTNSLLFCGGTIYYTVNTSAPPVAPLSSDDVSQSVCENASTECRFVSD